MLNLWKSISKKNDFMVKNEFIVKRLPLKTLFSKASKLSLFLFVPSMLGMALLTSCDKDDDDNGNCNCSSSANCYGKCRNCTCTKSNVSSGKISTGMLTY